MANVAYTAQSANVIARIRGLFAAAQENWDLYKEYRKTYAELNALSTRELDDIGIARADIEDIARVHVYGA